MANLSPAEKALYDKAVASGNTAAAAGISQIALVRMMGHTPAAPAGRPMTPQHRHHGGQRGALFQPQHRGPTGQAKAGFAALIAFLNAERVG
jgi:hypothetical protein